MQWHKKHSSGSFLYIAQLIKWNVQTYMAPRFVECSQTNPTPRLESYFCSLLLEFCHKPPNKNVAYESVVVVVVAQSA